MFFKVLKIEYDRPPTVFCCGRDVVIVTFIKSSTHWSSRTHIAVELSVSCLSTWLSVGLLFSIWHIVWRSGRPNLVALGVLVRSISWWILLNCGPLFRRAGTLFVARWRNFAWLGVWPIDTYFSTFVNFGPGVLPCGDLHQSFTDAIVSSWSFGWYQINKGICLIN